MFDFKLFLLLIRSLFPNWSFFDQKSDKFELQFKVTGSPSWQVISFNLKRTPFGLFFNMQANLALAQVRILEHFAQELIQLQGKGQAFDTSLESSTNFKLVCALLDTKINEIGLRADRAQFKILACGPTHKIEIYKSEWVTLRHSCP